MSDVNQDAGFSGSSDNTSSSSTDDQAQPFWQRCLYMFGFAILAYMTFWVLILMAVVQCVVYLIDKDANADLKKFSRNTVQYLFELMAFISFSSDERPFPFGKFPTVPE